MRAPAGLRLEYLSAAEYRAAGWPDVLGIAAFSGPPAPAPAPGASEIPVAEVNMPLLLGTADVYEVWRSGRPVESGRRARVHFRRSENLLFGCIALAESEISAEGYGADASAALQAVTDEAYREICATLDAVGYPHLLRVWNYLPDINRASHGIERYRLFNRARHEALRACGRGVNGNVPAASALGAPSGSPLVVYFLAGRTAPMFIENPRQVSAYRYPRRYGSHAPMFSRATLLRQRDGLMLFISGTASIVGHRSLHVGDTAAQTRETLANIAALLEEANRVERAARFSLGSLACKVYVRRPQDLPAIRAQLEATLEPSSRVIYLQADICRQDLLVEIEATAISALRADA
jgi:chorismate lyase / 3-hydroxybenzoate synthase